MFWRQLAIWLFAYFQTCADGEASWSLLPNSVFLLLGEDELFLWYGWPTKGIESYFQPEPLSDILTITNIWHTASRIWTCIKPEFRHSWMKLCSSDNQKIPIPIPISTVQPENTFPYTVVFNLFFLHLLPPIFFKVIYRNGLFIVVIFNYFCYSCFDLFSLKFFFFTSTNIYSQGFHWLSLIQMKIQVSERKTVTLISLT